VACHITHIQKGLQKFKYNTRSQQKKILQT